MSILVLNCGSSSIKFKLFTQTCEVLHSGLIERIFEKELGRGVIDGVCFFEGEIANHHVGMEKLFEQLRRCGAITSYDDITLVAHRVVHGGERFTAPILINETVIEAIERLVPLAPLHNPANLEGIKVAQAVVPNASHIAIFDTAFHQTMPKHAYRYAIPKEFYTNNAIRRYGFHGTSHRYIAEKTADYLNRPLETLNFITLHLGNGDSICAIRNGKSIDTSMGFTPLEGLMMGTRSGDIDPAIVFYMEHICGMDIKSIDHTLNHKSGLKGVCGDNDMRRILERAEDGDDDAILAVEMFVYRIRKYIGAYAVSLGSVDAIVFTGGIGEHSQNIRFRVCEGLEDVLGIIIGESRENEGVIAFEAPQSRIALLAIPTDEEYQMAKESAVLLSI